MGAFNTVVVPWVDRETSKQVELKVQFKYGDVWQHVYRIGDSLRWGGNDTGRPGERRVVIDGCLEGASLMPSVPQDFEVHVVDDKIEKVIPATGTFDFVRINESFIVL